MQQNGPSPPVRAQDNSPASAIGGDWYGNNEPHNGPLGPGTFRPPQRADSMTPPDMKGNFEPRPILRAQTFASGSPTGPGQYDQRRRPSDDKSRASSRAASSRASDLSLRDPHSRRYQNMESELRQHYTVLRAYLKGGSAAPPRTNKARDKLQRLSPVQFHELSTDVFDELQRRQAAAPIPGRPMREDKVPPFLQPRSDFHEKRNQARQKLSSLQTSRFRDLSTDVFCELERRFPQFDPSGRRDSLRSTRGLPMNGNGTPPRPNGFGPPQRAQTETMNGNKFPPRSGSIPTYVDRNNDFGRPVPKQFQSSTVVPTKSTMVEDEEDDDQSGFGAANRSSEAFGLDSIRTSPKSRRDTTATSVTAESRSMPAQPHELQDKIQELEYELQTRDSQIKELSANLRLQQELQEKLDAAERLNEQIRRELERIQDEQADMQESYQQHLSHAEATAAGGEWQAKHERLSQEHEQLQARYQHQLETTDQVSAQFQAQLVDIRTMAEESHHNGRREEELFEQNARMSEEIKEWKERYTKAKNQLGNLHASSIGLNTNSAKLKEEIFYDHRGIIPDLHVTAFQVSLDELLKTARSDESLDVIRTLRELVTAVRAITSDIDQAQTDKNDEQSKKRTRMKEKVISTANNVITAARNYATAAGLSPVSLLDAAASHLTAAMIDLLRIAKISRMGDQSNKLNLEDMTPINSNGYFETPDARQRNRADSVYSALSEGYGQDQTTPVVHQEPMSDNGVSNGLGIHTKQPDPDEVELDEFKIYLSDQTDELVQVIQRLVNSVRNEEEMVVVRQHVGIISDIVEAILQSSESAVEHESAFQALLTKRILPAFQRLSQCKENIDKAARESLSHEGKPSAKEFMQTIPPLAFQIAREAKELASKVESVVPGSVDENEGEEDFS